MFYFRNGTGQVKWGVWSFSAVTLGIQTKAFNVVHFTTHNLIFLWPVDIFQQAPSSLPCLLSLDWWPDLERVSVVMSFYLKMNVWMSVLQNHQCCRSFPVLFLGSVFWHCPALEVCAQFLDLIALCNPLTSTVILPQMSFKHVLERSHELKLQTAYTWAQFLSIAV